MGKSRNTRKDAKKQAQKTAKERKKEKQEKKKALREFPIAGFVRHAFCRP